jgi:predicted phage tail component-like protein
MMWFQFGDIRSDELNIKVLRIRKPILPEFQDHRETIPGLDGTILYPQPFESKPIEIDCLLQHADRYNKYVENRLLAKLYSREEQKLITSDEPDVFYLGKLSGNFTPDPHKTLSSFTLSFTCQPFAYSLNKKVINYRKSSSDLFTVTSDGTAYSEFKLTLTPQETIENINIKVGDAVLVYGEEVAAGESLVIDTDAAEAFIDGENVTINLFGEFPVLYPGENVVEIAANNDFSYEVTFEFYDRFM